MQYKEAVAEARQLVKRSEDDQWRLAELTWEQVERGKTRTQWAQDIGISDHWAGTLYRVWEAWSASASERRPPFSEAWRAFQNPERGGHSAGSREATKNTLRSWPPEQKAEVVREALDDQDVAVRVLRDPHTRRNVTDAREQVANEIETAARDRTDADPQSRAIREASLTINIESNISKARFWLAEATRQIQDLEDRDPAVMERLGRDVDDVDLALGWLRTALEGGRVSDEDLARLLDGGA
jgi:hypothetical protein